MKKFSIKNRKGLKIVGELHTPEYPIGLAFVQHGLGGFKEQPNTIAMVQPLFDARYTVVNFDATNSFGESDGRYEQATMQLHYEDLVDVIAWAKTQEWYREPFVLAGHSLGGYAVAQYAEDHPKEVKAVFPFALVVSGEQSLQKYEQLKPDELKKWKETGWKEEESKSKPGVIKRLPWSHMEERQKHDLRPHASRLTMPVLFVMGEYDTSCSPDTQRTLYDLVPGPKEWHIVKGARHTFTDERHLAELRGIVADWLAKIK